MDDMGDDDRTRVLHAFREIHANSRWGRSSVSGPGSTLGTTTLIRPRLREFFESYGVQSVLDAPCGDGSWISELADAVPLYLGVDIVPEIIQKNIERFTSTNRFFRTADIIRDKLPTVDVILCRDCLVHLPFTDVRAAIRNFAATGSRFLATTSFFGHPTNTDLSAPGGWRPLNLQAAPFDFPPPELLLREKRDDPDYQYSDKSLLVWELASLAPYLGR